MCAVDVCCQLGELNEWSKKTNTELATHIPLLIRVPWIKASVGARTKVKMELVDLCADDDFNHQQQRASYSSCMLCRSVALSLCLCLCLCALGFALTGTGLVPPHLQIVPWPVWPASMSKLLSPLCKA